MFISIKHEREPHGRIVLSTQLQLLDSVNHDNPNAERIHSDMSPSGSLHHPLPVLYVFNSRSNRLLEFDYAHQGDMKRMHCLSVGIVFLAL